MSSDGIKRVVCAAIRHVDGRIVASPRHFDMTAYNIVMQFPDKETWRGAEQGFVNTWGEWLTREEAWLVADANDQIIKDRDWQTGILHSEHLY